MGMGFVKHIVGLLNSKTMGLENFEHIQELCLVIFIFLFFLRGVATLGKLEWKESVLCGLQIEFGCCCI